jgi:zinc transporter 1
MVHHTCFPPCSKAHLYQDHGHHGHHHGHGTGNLATTADLEQSSAETLCAHSIATSQSNISKRHKGHQHTLQQPPSGCGKRDVASLAVLLHVLMDAINNIGVIIAALVIWQAHYSARYYADPGVSMGISIMIIVSTFSISIKSSKSTRDMSDS